MATHPPSWAVLLQVRFRNIGGSLAPFEGLIHYDSALHFHSSDPFLGGHLEFFLSMKTHFWANTVIKWQVIDTDRDHPFPSQQHLLTLLTITLVFVELGSAVWRSLDYTNFHWPLLLAHSGHSRGLLVVELCWFCHSEKNSCPGPQSSWEFSIVLQ